MNKIDELREELAELCHRQWAGWMEYLFSKCSGDGESIVIPEWAVARWKRQIATDYKDLSGPEQDSDRKEADKFISIFRAAIAARDRRIESIEQEWRASCKAWRQRAERSERERDEADKKANEKFQLSNSVQTMQFAECLGILDGINQVLVKLGPAGINDTVAKYIGYDIDEITSANRGLLNEWRKLAKIRAYVHTEDEQNG